MHNFLFIHNIIKYNNHKLKYILSNFIVIFMILIIIVNIILLYKMYIMNSYEYLIFPSVSATNTLEKLCNSFITTSSL